MTAAGDGLGTGLAELPTRAPKLHAMIEAAITALPDPADAARAETPAAAIREAMEEGQG